MEGCEVENRESLFSLAWLVDPVLKRLFVLGNACRLIRSLTFMGAVVTSLQHEINEYFAYSVVVFISSEMERRVTAFVINGGDVVSLGSCIYVLLQLQRLLPLDILEH